MRHRIFLSILLVLGARVAFSDDLRTATRKIEEIKSDHLRPGTVVVLTLPELNAWVATQLPDGVRNGRLRIDSPGIATGTAMVDIARVSRAKGFDPGWLLSKILEGERPVLVTARIQASRGSAIVTVKRVEVSGLDIDGKTLDMLIEHVLLPVYPDAAVNRPFDMSHNVERLDIEPTLVRVAIGKPK
ncbi:MAG TPA: hypothetical protein VML19_27365 [Verrucomicrobiae bacterium]|nr:hypothetical protein [Verrucomicrobiae bacterium]